MKGVFIREARALVPYGDPALEALRAIRIGKTCIADVHGARNVKQLNLWWALCTLVAEADDDDKQNVSDWIEMVTRRVRPVFYPSGRMVLVPQSLAFESMEQAEFNRLFSDAIEHMASRLGTAPEELRARFNEMVDPTKGYHIR